MPLTRYPLTWRHGLQYPEDGNCHEVIDGEHCTTPAPTFEHQQIVGALFFLLQSWLAAAGRGRVVASPVDVVLSEHDLVQPDIVVLLHGGSARVVEGRIHGVPDLVVEVLSPATRERDLGVKRMAYQRAGVPRYWVVDPERRSVTALALTPSGYETEATAMTGENWRPAALPGLEIPVAGLFTF